MSLAARRRTALALLALPLAGGARAAGAQPARGAAAAVSAPVTNVRYDVDAGARAARAREIPVRMSFDVTGAAPVLLSLPAWTPGSYQIASHARRVRGFDAEQEGRESARAPLAWDKLDADTWRVRPTGAGRVSVRFAVAADTLDTAASWTQPDFVFFNGTNLFPYAEGRPLDYAATVHVATERGWQIATGMTPAAERASFTAPTYHDLVDMPFFIGRFDLDSAQIAGRWTRLATYPSGSVAGVVRSRVWGALRRMIPPQVAVFGDVPWPAYTILQIVDASAVDLTGLEHQSSHVDVVPPHAVDHPLMLSLYAHEVFHAWNVKRLRPADLVPYRYDVPQPTPWLWVSEGVTDYYADLALVRGGVVDSAGFFALTSAKVNAVAAVPRVAPEDASLSAWIAPTDGTATIYYQQGSLAGLLLDILVRDASDNRRSLDDAMRALYATAAQTRRGFTAEDWWGALGDAATGAHGPAKRGRPRAWPPLAAFEARHIDGREPFPYDSVLPLGGMRLVLDTIREPQLGLGTRADAGGVLVVDVGESSTAARAGVRAGDYLLAVNDVPATDAQFAERVARTVGAGRDAARVRVRRGADVLTLGGRMQFTTRVERRVEADPRASARAARVRGGILHGAVDR